MAISLDGLSLPDLIWEDEFEWDPIETSMELTLGGRPVVWEDDILAGRPITLSAHPDQGWLTRSQVLSLKEKAEVKGATYILDYEGQLFTVRFRRELGTAVEVEPVVPRPNHQNGDYYTGRVRLITVS